MIQDVSHPFAPIYNAHTRVLLLGTMPSPRSREEGFYYGHPRNRFWKVLGSLLQEDPGKTAEEKQKFLLRHGIGLWDVLASCQIDGAADASIRQPLVNDFTAIVAQTKLQKVFTTGTTAYKLYNQYSEIREAFPAICLPSTSPANARMGVDELVERYRIILSYL